MEREKKTKPFFSSWAHINYFNKGEAYHIFVSTYFHSTKQMKEKNFPSHSPPPPLTFSFNSSGVQTSLCPPVTSHQ